MDPGWVRRLRRALLNFYDNGNRALPWRAAGDPYRVWVSEIMLQQTRVATVLPYYERWLARFPTLGSLAAAEPDDVLRIWQGLGYYQRARNLHRAARIVIEQMDGRVPDTAEALAELPGIGDYTAGAIASIAFGRREPAVDGNVRRLVCRLLDAGDIAPGRLRAIAASFVPRRRPGDFNQAMMELGATVCTPRAPACGACPLRRLCRSRARGTQLERPARRAARPLPVLELGTALVRDERDRLLLVRQPETGRLAGLWVFPSERIRPGESSRAAARRACRRQAGTPARGAMTLGRITHDFSHLREVHHAFGFRLEGGRRTGSGRAWVEPADLPEFALPAAHRRLAGLAGATA